MTFHLIPGVPRPSFATVHGPFDLLALSGPVNTSPAATGADVAKVQALLAGAGAFDLAPDDGPSGRADHRFGAALRGTLRTLGVAVDGLVNADGPTLRALAALPGRVTSPPGRASSAAPCRCCRHRRRRAWTGTPASSCAKPRTVSADYFARIWGMGMPGMANAIELLGRIGERDRSAARRAWRTLASRIATTDRPLLFAGDLVRTLSRNEFAAGENIVQKFLAGKLGTTVAVTRPVQMAQTPPPPVQIVPTRPVPAYRAQVFNNFQNVKAWSNFLGALQGVPGLSRAEQKAFADIFAAEGGLIADRSTVAGITQKTLDDIIARGHVIGIKAGTKPVGLNMNERVRVYRGYFDLALRRAGGSKAMRLIGDSDAASAFADVVFRHGSTGGGRIIQIAINVVSRNPVTVDGVVGPNTMKAFAELVADPSSRRALLQAIAGERRRAVANSPNLAGERARIDYFRFQRSP